MALYKTKGIVLKSRPFEEAGKLVTFFTRDFGKITAIAKGAKRPTSKFGGRLEPFTLLDLSIASGRNLDILSQCETINNFRAIRENSKLLKMGMYFLKVINKATEERQKNPGLFKLLAVSLMKLSEGEPLDKLERYFDVNFLRVEGLFRKDIPPDILIGEHLGEDVRPWKI